MTTGTLIRNTDPHQKCSNRKPPRIGPSAAPTTANDPPNRDREIALPFDREGDPHQGQRRRHHRCRAPTARNARAAIRILAEGENAATSEAMPNSTRPIRNICRWPMRITQRAGSKQQPSHHQRIGIDDPQPLCR